MNPTLSNRPAARVLVIDDDAGIHAAIRQVLGHWPFRGGSPRHLPTASGPAITALQFEVTSTYHGEGGLAAVRESVQTARPFAVAFVDVRMPGWDGVETTCRLWEADPDLQVVLCSAFSDYCWEDIVSRLGISDRLVILKKPFEAIEVRQLSHVLAE
ncbi:MAG TPA: response regulator, partial [Dongiaceae bacterium]|nr:response regulator [Dongiaceae bacterium]